MTPSLRSDWLFAFGVFAEHLSFTHAARALGLSQPALHVQITRLAEELGVPLYTKRGRALELTRAGIDLLAFARESRERDDTFIAHLRQEAGHDSVVLASGEGAYLYLLGESIRAFSRAHCAKLRLLTRDRTGTVAAVLSGEAHLGVAALDDAPDGIVAERFATIQQVVLLPAHHPMAKKKVLALADLEGEALVVPPSDRPHRIMVAAALATAGVSWKVGAEANGWELIAHFARMGLGLAIVNGFVRVPKGLISRPIRGLPPIHYSLLQRWGALRGAGAARLRNLIVGERAD